jgi:hypothetical protein
MVTQSTDDYEKLQEIRLIYKTEMLKAISCRTKRQKIKLAKEWESRFSNMTYKELIALARNHSARLKVAYWDLGNFETKKLNKHS